MFGHGTEIRQAINEEIARFARSVLSESLLDEDWTYLCECGNPACRHTLILTLQDYQTARSLGDGLVVVSEHATRAVVLRLPPRGR
jgi:hypothetical protein